MGLIVMLPGGVNGVISSLLSFSEGGNIDVVRLFAISLRIGDYSCSSRHCELFQSIESRRIFGKHLWSNGYIDRRKRQ